MGGGGGGTVAEHLLGKGEQTDLSVMGSLNAFEATPCTRSWGPRNKFVGHKQW